MHYRHWSSRDEWRSSKPHHRYEVDQKPCPQNQMHPNNLIPESAFRPKWENRRSEELRRGGGDYRRNHRSDEFDDDCWKRRKEEYDSSWRKEKNRWRGRDWGHGANSSGRRAEFSRGYRKNRRFGFRERRARSEDRDIFELGNRDDEHGIGNLDDRDEAMSDENGEVRDGEIENGGLLEVCGFVNVPTKPRRLLAQRRRKLGVDSLSSCREPPLNYNINLNKVAFDEEVEINSIDLNKEASDEELIHCRTELFGSSLKTIDVQEEINRVVKVKNQHTTFKVCDLNLQPNELEDVSPSSSEAINTSLSNLTEVGDCYVGNSATSLVPAKSRP